MSSPMMRLFCDRKSHPSRACLLLLRSTGLKHEEVSTDLFRGQHLKKPELPFKKLPVLLHGEVRVAESTSILRYIALTSGMADHWYPKDVAARIKVEEFLDFWQSTMNPNTVKLVQNKLMYKMMFRLPAADEKKVGEALKLHQKDKQALKDYFLKGQSFIGGETGPSIGDLLAACTLQQTALAGADHTSEKSYLERVTASVPGYAEVNQAALEMPDVLKKMKML